MWPERGVEGTRPFVLSPQECAFSGHFFTGFSGSVAISRPSFPARPWNLRPKKRASVTGPPTVTQTIATTARINVSLIAGSNAEFNNSRIQSNS